VYRSFHIWRICQHLGQGNLRMAVDAWATPHDEFSFADALVLSAWIAGVQAELSKHRMPNIT
jgi:hypothetical protein